MFLIDLLDNYENEDDLVQYTVELYKKGEPLGITITGSEDSRLPISIQELSPGNINHKKLENCICINFFIMFNTIFLLFI